MIPAIILAAGNSARMGSPKMLLPWGNVTIIEHVISVFSKAGVDDILVVTGGNREQVESVVKDCEKHYPVRSVYNENYAAGDMLSSIQCGLRNLANLNVSAVMIGLGDQPQVQERSVSRVLGSFLRTQSPLVVPSFQMRRGHPWLVARLLWGEIIELKPTQTPRDFLNVHASDIHYVNVDTPSIIADLDTLEEYRASHP